MTYFFVYGLTLIVFLWCITAPLGSVKQILLFVLFLFLTWASSAAYRLHKAKVLKKISDELTPNPETRVSGNQKYFPKMQDARLVKRFEADTHEIILLTDVKSSGLIKYTHLLAAFKKGQKEPSYVIAAEVNNLYSPGDDSGSHFLCSYPGSGHINYGESDEWGDLTRFEQKACEMMTSQIGKEIKIIKPI